MGRRAARLERAGALTPRDMIWAAIRELSALPLEPPLKPTFSAVEVAYLVNARRAPDQQLAIDSVEQYLEGLSKAEPPYISRRGMFMGKPVAARERSQLWQWQLERDVGVDAPRVTRDGRPVTQGAGNEAMWAAMKVLKDFDAAELAQAASAGGTAVQLRSARMYCVWLAHAGYLAVAAVSSGHRGTRYRFNKLKNTGPRAPLISEHNKVIDGNTGAVVYEREGKACRGRT